MKVFENFFSFEGRINRLQYGIRFVAAAILGLAASGLIGQLSFFFSLPIENQMVRNGIGLSLFMTGIVITYISLVSLTVRRAHDMNFRGWWTAAAVWGFFATPLFFMFVFFLAHAPCASQDNRFGPAPPEGL